ncbi:MAG: hypothetical protein E7387_02075 [Ruminococcaceae bacterium]|nr:hypothetical protein [Oscillospiraceae bacterium]
MASREENLHTKDKKQIEKIYKKIKKYVIRVGAKIEEKTESVKEARIDYITQAYKNKDVLLAVVSDIAIKDYLALECEAADDGPGLYCYGQYLYSMGLINTVYDEDGDFYAATILELWELLFSAEKDLFEEIGCKAAVNSAVSAMTNLYGIIKFEKAYEIFCKVTHLGGKTSFEKFIETAMSFADFREEYNICVYMDCFVSGDYLNVQNVRGVKKITPLPGYYELVCRQGDKPFYTEFTVAELLNYEFPGSFEINSYIDNFMKFLSETFDRSEKAVFDMTDEVYRACVEECGINVIFDLLENKGFYSKSQKIQKTLVKHIMQIKSNIRLRVNRGFTINELRGISYESATVCSNL